MKNKEDIDKAFRALLGLPPVKVEEVQTTWFLCVPDGSGTVQRYDTPNLAQVEQTARQWLASGWPVWVEDDQGRHLHLADMPRELN